ncbi:MAG: hypothetical protein ACREST_03450 [Steroidobacteraceae bacterium]
MFHLIRIVLATTLFAGTLLAVPRAMAQDPAAQPAAPAAAPAADLRYSNKWRIQVSEGANNDGVMRFRVTPQGGVPIEIPVTLKDGRGEDGCARDIRDAFKKSLDRKAFNIDLDDGEDVLVKKRKGPDFALELVESTVQGTRVNLDRE